MRNDINERSLVLPFKKPGPSAYFEKVKGGHYLKEILTLNSFFFEDKDSRFKRLKPGLALIDFKDSNE